MLLIAVALPVSTTLLISKTLMYRKLLGQVSPAEMPAIPAFLSLFSNSILVLLVSRQRCPEIALQLCCKERLTQAAVPHPRHLPVAISFAPGVFLLWRKKEALLYHSNYKKIEGSFNQEITVGCCTAAAQSCFGFGTNYQQLQHQWVKILLHATLQ